MGHQIQEMVALLRKFLMSPPPAVSTIRVLTVENSAPSSNAGANREKRTSWPKLLANVGDRAAPLQAIVRNAIVPLFL